MRVNPVHAETLRASIRPVLRPAAPPRARDHLTSGPQRPTVRPPQKQGPPRCGLPQRICEIFPGVRGCRWRSRTQPNLEDLHPLELRRTACSSYPPRLRRRAQSQRRQPPSDQAGVADGLARRPAAFVDHPAWKAALRAPVDPETDEEREAEAMRLGTLMRLASFRTKALLIDSRRHVEDGAFLEKNLIVEVAHKRHRVFRPEMEMNLGLR